MGKFIRNGVIDEGPHNSWFFVQNGRIKKGPVNDLPEEIEKLSDEEQIAAGWYPFVEESSCDGPEGYVHDGHQLQIKDTYVLMHYEWRPMNAKELAESTKTLTGTETNSSDMLKLLISMQAKIDSLESKLKT